MSCSRNRAKRWVAGPNFALALAPALALALAACATAPAEPVALPPPAPVSVGGSPGSSGDIWLVRSASPALLEKYPRGTPMPVGREICLKSGEQITFQSNRGKSLTYTGPGCARRAEPGTPTNEGGFIFGWNGPGGLVPVEVAP